ncbi:protein of unknown function [Sphingobacterium nematocida]|uniref:DUF5007 domain-containing protein n=1 Tax=Sphingobacterium nematocida TaxID=1513896 RepID=A0A1T5GH78_9SPHI|nr:DUF5007 domain-containing protein [Sphingobacterium nematocida]SKC07690.1 protein of unknown function [Sphingobacterium nematocida]
MKSVIKTNLLLQLLAGALVITSCKSLIPDSVDALGDDVNYLTTEYTPTLGRKTVFENAATMGTSSSFPLDFKLVNVRRSDGEPATELTDKFPMKVWKSKYTAEEKSIAEIEAKRVVEYRSILEVGKNSGDIMFWDFGNSNWIKTQPDPGYEFDVEISNSGGRKYARNLKLKPFKERAYEPSQYNEVTGLAANAALPISVAVGLVGERTGDYIFGSDIQVFVIKDTENKTPGGTLSISLMDSLNNPLDIRLFKDTEWNKMIHGFNPVFKDNKVTYDVAYPIPLVKYPSNYTTSDGSMARILLRCDRVGFGGLLSPAMLGFNFSIYEEGHWEIQFRFRGETPKFDND